ncbi:hypothetical protein SRHO_G00037990 [Serrasalmus rhombeus]
MNIRNEKKVGFAPRTGPSFLPRSDRSSVRRVRRPAPLCLQAKADRLGLRGAELRRRSTRSARHPAPSLHPCAG